ncbi:MAG: ribosome silencing factor [Gammaproteobacteria bacterium RIFCSPHIGHO2_12_FULL_38_11]|nr:MAG: ribosome silencing factor [Gammaproteobacteria bacterium RIFCSPHIGHO2_12_FULL_38_11]
MNLNELVKLVRKHLDDNKAQDVTELDVTKLTDCTDIMVIATGTSTRHVQSIAKKLISAVKESGVRPLGIEGELTGEWVLVDLGDVLVHIMLKSERELYDLEGLWTAAEQHRLK